MCNGIRSKYELASAHVTIAMYRYDNCLELEASCALDWLADMAGCELVQENQRALRQEVAVVTETVLTVLQQIPTRASIQAGGLRVLAQLRACGLNRCKAVDCSSDRVAVRAMKNHPSHAEVQVFGLANLSCMLISTPLCEASVSSGICALAVTSLRSHPKHLGVQRNALMVLNQLAASGKGAAGMQVKGAVKAAVYCLRNHIWNMELQSLGILLLGYLSRHSTLVDRLVHSGAIEVVVNALQMFSKDREIQENGLLVLVNLSLSGAHVGRMVKTRVVEVTRTALRTHLDHSTVEAYGLYLLGILIDRLMLEHGSGMFIKCRSAIVDAMEAHPMHANVQASGSHILRKFASHVERIKEDADMYSVCNRMDRQRAPCSAVQA